MAESIDQSIENAEITEQQAPKQYEIHLRDKACAALYKNKKGSDVNFLFFEQNTTDDAEKILIGMVPAHKIILAAASPVFDAEFFGSIKEIGDVEIVDSSLQAFEEFLKCFYFGTVTFTMENIPDVMNLANKYDVADCMTACVQFLIEHLSLENIFSVYGLAMLHEQQALMKSCDEFIVSNTNKVLKSEEFLVCDQKFLREILKLDLRCEESLVFDRCLAWAKNACKFSGKNENVASNLRDELGDCLYLIRFGSMTIEKFLEATLNCEDIFTTHEMGDIMRSIASKEFVSQKFNKNPRLYWDENKIWSCKPISYGNRRNFQNIETVYITSNKQALLGAIVASIYDDYGNSCFDTEISIMEIEGQSFASESGKLLFEKMKMTPQIKTNHIRLPTPIVINPENTYQICVEIKNYNRKLYFVGSNYGPVGSKTGLTITFKGEINDAHIIPRLDLIEF